MTCVLDPIEHLQRCAFTYLRARDWCDVSSLRHLELELGHRMDADSRDLLVLLAQVLTTLHMLVLRADEITQYTGM